MTAEEIRATRNSSDDGAWQCADFLKEIAALLAEQNEQIRADREFRRVLTEEQRANQKKHDDLLASSAAGIDAFRKSVEAPAPIPPRVVVPGEAWHLGCIVREPDGVYAITHDNGVTRLEPEEAKRILALMQPPPAETGKPS